MPSSVASPRRAPQISVEKFNAIVQIMTETDRARDHRITIPRRLEKLVTDPRLHELTNLVLLHIEDAVVNHEDDSRANYNRRTHRYRAAADEDCKGRAGLTGLDRCAELYGQILLENMGWGLNMQEDQNFFESVYFLLQRLTGAWARERLGPASYDRLQAQIEAELGRLFRSPPFNHEERHMLLREAKLEKGDKGRRMRRKVVTKTDTRSPLLSLLLPSPREKAQHIEAWSPRKRTPAQLQARASSREGQSIPKVCVLPALEEHDMFDKSKLAHAWARPL